MDINTTLHLQITAALGSRNQRRKKLKNRIEKKHFLTQKGICSWEALSQIEIDHMKKWKHKNNGHIKTRKETYLF